MSQLDSSSTGADVSASSPWLPSERCRGWLLVGAIAIAVDFALSVTSTVLEFRHWGEDGLTPDVLVSYAALPVQGLLIGSLLVVARDAGIRGLWKSAAGMLGSFLLALLLELVLLDVVTERASQAILIATAAGLLGLLMFTFSGFPRFEAPAQPDPTTPQPESESSAGWGWLGYLGALVVYLVVKGIVRKVLRGFRGGGFGVEEWAILELLFVMGFGFAFALWFALTKIRHRGRLGAGAGLVGGIEILVLLVHLGLGATLLTVIVMESAANPNLDDAGIDRLLTPWLQRGSLISLGCHGLWAVVTATFFLVLRSRTLQDWSPK